MSTTKRGTIISTNLLLAQKEYDKGVMDLKEMRYGGKENTEDYKIKEKGVSIYRDFLNGTISNFDFNERLKNLRK